MQESINVEEILSRDGAKIYFVGIGGIAMSAAANIAKEYGFTVSGSDGKQIYSPAKDVLDSNDIDYHIGYDREHIISAKADLYVLSAGEDLNNPEVKYIVDENLLRVGFAELLFELTRDSLRVVVAGTHGKSTTTGLLGHLLKNLDNSSFMTGAVLQNYQSNFYKGDGHYFVFEGDEYKEEFDDPTPKFHYYKPDILVLNNLEFDHPDQFATFSDMEEEFGQLIDTMPEDGLIVYNADDANLSRLVHRSNIATASFGIENEADFKADGIDFGPQATTLHVSNKFSAKNDVVQALGLQEEEYQIQLPGKMNVYNALAAIAALRTLGFSRESFALDLLSYQGVKRRFELVGMKNGVTIIDDYAHHPTAVRETLEAARLRYFEGKGAASLNPLPFMLNPKLWAVFEPHTFSRTKALLSELANCFEAADEVLISEIYPARESAKDATVSSQDVVRAIKDHNSKFNIQNSIRPVQSKQQALEVLKSELKPSDVVIVMAVGSFNRLAYELLEIL